MSKITKNGCKTGVSHKLAIHRKQQINNISYNLIFRIPEKKTEPVRGRLHLKFSLSNNNNDVILDFQNGANNILSFFVNSQKDAYTYINEHIIIPASSCKEGENIVETEFISGNSSLNRHNNYLYTLFVPDKASIAFPCFDQPDMKASFELELYIPARWTAVSSGKIISNTTGKNVRHLKFKKTEIISTYHFAFVAGKLQQFQQTKNGRTINFYHVEESNETIYKNTNTLFSMHLMSLEWMEKYTNIKYPFDKLDFISIPSFQFSGMEHVGIIYYRSSRIFLSESASVEETITRASVIAHEVSHMWFGNLVTMRWFDDVWLKEVYAELFAAKIVYPMFPDMNHDINFVTYNYPRAYQTDRSKGTHPIQQVLDNLKFAGTLYDDIIYFKAPIVMANLEQMIGDKAMQEGLREYLKTYSFGNADWNDLIKIFDKHTEFNLEEWSEMWVMQEGMPVITANIDYVDNKISSFRLSQKDMLKKNRLWKQNLSIFFCKNGKSVKIPIYFDKNKLEVSEAIGLEKPDCILLNGSAYGYGYFKLNNSYKEFLLKNVFKIKNELARSSAYISMFEAVVNYDLKTICYIKSMLRALKTEKIKQNIQLILNNIEIAWWFFINERNRVKYAREMETLLIKIARLSNEKEVKAAVFKRLVSIFVSKNTQDYLYEIWNNKLNFQELQLSGTDYSSIALALSVRDYPDAESIVNKQIRRIKDNNKRDKFKFLKSAVSINPAVRDKFFESLKNPENRQKEVWVRSALYYLNHPLRAKQAVKYLPDTLNLLEEVQQTGDIFFPKNWLAYSIGRHNSKDAVEIVDNFLKQHIDYNKNLRYKILQLSDFMHRANKRRKKNLVVDSLQNKLQ